METFSLKCDQVHRYNLLSIFVYLMIYLIKKGMLPIRLTDGKSEGSFVVLLVEKIVYTCWHFRECFFICLASFMMIFKMVIFRFDKLLTDE